MRTIALIFPLILMAGCAKEESAPPATNATTSAPAPGAPTSSAASNQSSASSTAAPNASATSATPMPVAPAAPPSPATPPAGGAEVAVGQPAPDFTGTDQAGKQVHLAALKGKPVVVYFYPKDETPGCTKEACAFRDAWNDLAKKGVVLIGISADTAQSHKAFAEHHKLPFTLVSDPKGEIAAKFGVPFENGYDKRQSFVIGADGNVKKIYRQVDVSHHAAEISADVQ